LVFNELGTPMDEAFQSSGSWPELVCRIIFPPIAQGQEIFQGEMNQPTLRFNVGGY
jgi:hypothetical protein